MEIKYNTSLDPLIKEAIEHLTLYLIRRMRQELPNIKAGKTVSPDEILDQGVEYSLGLVSKIPREILDQHVVQELVTGSWKSLAPALMAANAIGDPASFLKLAEEKMLEVIRKERSFSA